MLDAMISFLQLSSETGHIPMIFFSLGSWHLHIRVFLSAAETLVTSGH